MKLSVLLRMISKLSVAGMDLAAVFPLGKINAQSQSHKDVGKIPKPTEESIACFSAILIQKLVDKGDKSSESVVTLDQIKAAASQYDFINLDEVQNQTAPKAAKNKHTTIRKVVQAVQKELLADGTTTRHCKPQGAPKYLACDKMEEHVAVGSSVRKQRTEEMNESRDPLTCAAVSVVDQELRV